MKKEGALHVIIIEGEHAAEIRQAAYKYLAKLLTADMKKNERPQ